MLKRLVQSLYLHRGALSLLTGAQLINIVAGLVSSVLWTRAFPSEVYGSYQFILSAIGIASSFCLQGLSQSASLSSAKRKDGNLIPLIREKMLAGLVAGLGLAAYAYYIYLHGQREVGLALAIAAPLVPALVLPDLTVSWLNGRRDYRLLTIAQTIPSLVSMASLAVAYLMKVNSTLLIVLGTQGTLALLNLFVAREVSRKCRTNDERDPALIRFGHHASLAGLFGWVIYADRFLIHEKLSAHDLAVYSVAMIFPGQLRTLYSVATQFITPDMSEETTLSGAWEKVKFKIGVSFASFAFIGLGGFFLLPYFIPLFFSAKYAEAVPYGKWLFLAFALGNPSAFFGNLLRAQQKTAFYYAYEIIQPILTLALYAALISKGLNGMMWAQVIRQLFFGGVMIVSFYVYLARERKLKR